MERKRENFVRGLGPSSFPRPPSSTGEHQRRCALREGQRGGEEEEEGGEEEEEEDDEKEERGGESALVIMRTRRKKASGFYSSFLRSVSSLESVSSRCLYFFMNGMSRPCLSLSSPLFYLSLCFVGFAVSQTFLHTQAESLAMGEEASSPSLEFLSSSASFLSSLPSLVSSSFSACLASLAALVASFSRQTSPSSSSAAQASPSAWASLLQSSSLGSRLSSTRPVQRAAAREGGDTAEKQTGFLSSFFLFFSSALRGRREQEPGTLGSPTVASMWGTTSPSSSSSLFSELSAEPVDVPPVLLSYIGLPLYDIFCSPFSFLPLSFSWSVSFFCFLSWKLFGIVFYAVACLSYVFISVLWSIPCSLLSLFSSFFSLHCLLTLAATTGVCAWAYLDLTNTSRVNLYFSGNFMRATLQQ